MEAQPTGTGWAGGLLLFDESKVRSLAFRWSDQADGAYRLRDHPIVSWQNFRKALRTLNRRRYSQAKDSPSSLATRSRLSSAATVSLACAIFCFCEPS